jgi:signal transduction histidine kinase
MRYYGVLKNTQYDSDYNFINLCHDKEHFVPNIITKVLLLLLTTLTSTVVISQGNSNIGHIGIEDGLRTQLSLHLLEDDEYNLWISSFQDLQKYNGHSVTAIPIDTRNSKPLNNLADICKDQLGNIWIIQGSDGYYINKEKYLKPIIYYKIDIIDPQSHQSTSFDDYIKSDKLKQEDIVNIQPFEEKIFITTTDGEIYSFKESLEHYTTIQDTSTYISLNEKGELISYKDGAILFSDNQGRLIHEIKDQPTQEYDILNVSPTGQLFFWEQKGGQNILSNYSNGQFKEIYTEEINPDFINEYRYHRVESYDDGYLIVKGQLLNIEDSIDLTLKTMIGDNTVYDHIKSNSGLEYFSTNLGVFINSNRKKTFKQLGVSKNKLNSVRAIFVNEHIKAYRGKDKELIINNSNYYNLDFLKGKDLGPDAEVHYLDPLNQDVLWSAGYIDGHVRKIDFKKQSLETFTFSPHGPYSPSAFLRSSMTNRLYLSSASGVFILDEKKKLFNKINLNSLSAEHISINHMIEINDQIWIASSQGVIIIDELNNQISLDPIRSDSINYVLQHIHADKINPNIVWIGTRRGGLIKWDTTTDTIQNYNISSGLSNNDVHAIIEDKQERLWVSTNQYLNCLDKRNDRIYVFTEQDGLSHSEFNKLSYFHDTIQDVIYFGGLNGYNYFKPDDIVTNNIESRINVRLIGAANNKKDGTIENVLSDAIRTSSIDFNEDVISTNLELSTNYLYQPDKVKYSYRIPGIIEEWQSQSSNETNISRLPYGNHKLELIADLKKPSRTSEILVIDINCKRPFYKTWIFYILSALLILLIIRLVFKYQLKNISDRNIKLEETVANRTKELQELNNTKNKIFTIIAHDLRNPVSSLVDISEKIKFLSKHNRLDELEFLAEQTKNRINALNDNLNNILIWALNEKNILKLNPQKLSLVLEIKKILSIYSDEIKKKNITTQLNLIDVDQVYIDVSILQTILRNFINNAIKFSYDYGKITFSKNEETKFYIELEIKDNGIGFEKTDYDQKDKNIRKEGKGSGIGMIISKDLAQIAGVDIIIKSNNGIGTIVLIKIPKKIT